MVLCLVIALAPAGWLEVVSSVHWQHEIIHLTGLVGVGLAAAWPWATRRGKGFSGRFFAWLLLGTAALSVYIVSTSPLFLVTGFSILFTGLLDVLMARAHVASSEYRNRLERRINS